ncbi:hypothetical protein [Flavobacterium reichenbachii]|uniref:Uncharacterized protein n=1 Tax=Flavobacterium reichenbachii TaxID=362418 RepID=A0A085ZP29_9FLAO|nr:hypothetical protein [Flavobacterium reichenbachii]KFF06193.1 hypothetical protein IW19_11920 [Flavobacterium reichenbachii]OXB17584.1 hypothetical protein B0A68_04650 [Flavobacterium reichenbachii]
MKSLISVFFLLFYNIAAIYSQSKKETYQFSRDIDFTIEKDTAPWKYQAGATAYSMSGYYKKALETWDKNGATIPKITKADSLYIKEFIPQNAKDYIIKRSKNEKIIIINEAHNNARHRVFTTSILQGLYNNGFRFLGVEALSDSLINKRKFPVLESGFYTKEPEFGNLISEAVKIGFTVFGYDDFSSENITGKDREIKQAQNISRWIEKNPKGKFLIHCGYDHVIEGIPGIKSWEKAMAGRLTEFTGINPFTIDQIQYSERGDLKLNQPYIQILNLDYPAILVDSNGKTFNGSIDNPKKIDCSIIHPVTKFDNGIPAWKTLQGKRKAYSIPSSKIKEFPALVTAYRINEFEKNGIPADIVEILNADQNGKLLLNNGRYKIVIKNKEYKVTDEFLFTMKN